MDTLIHFCFSSRVRVYTKKACKSRNIFHMGLPLWCLEQKREALMPSGPLFKGIFPLFTKREYFFFNTFSYKSFPFYNWTFGVYLIFIIVCPLVSGTRTALLTAQGTLLYVKEGPDLKSPCQSFWDFKTFMVPGFSKQQNFL